MTAHPARPSEIHLGDLRVRYLPDGEIRTDPRRAYPEHHQHTQGPKLDVLDEEGLLVLSVGAILVEGPTFRALIDVGIGPRRVPTVSAGTKPGMMVGGNLLTSLADADLRPEDIDAVLLSHLHLDHVGWITKGDGDEPTFPNAEYFLGAGEFDYWYGVRNSAHWTGPSAEQLRTIGSRRHDANTGDSPRPGITALLTPGHTPGHAGYILHGPDGERAIVVGDALHTTVEIAHPHICWTGDVDPETATATRQSLVAEIAKPGTRVIGPHFATTVFPTSLHLPGSVPRHQSA